MANLLANTFAKNSSDENFDRQFLEFKRAAESQSIVNENVFSEELNHLNLKIELNELQSTLMSCKNSSPGPDGIPNILIKELPLVALKYLLELYNCI